MASPTPNSTTPASLITGGPCDLLFRTTVLGRYDVGYFRCRATGFIQTEQPYWLEQAYSDAISDLDVGCVARNIRLATQTSHLMGRHFPQARRLIDYGAGYGMFVRLMRDHGYDCRWYDPFCENLFARGYEAGPAGEDRFDVVTAFEVFEHSTNPLGDVESMFERAPTILFSTLLVPPGPIRSPDDWWYFIPITGQHVAFHTRESLAEIAKQFDATLHTDGFGLHILTREKIRTSPFSLWGKLSVRKLLGRFSDRFFPLNRQTSLQDEDYRMTQLRLQKAFQTEPKTSRTNGQNDG